MQFQIPQNVDIEDKILSFLTMRQLIILVSGGVVAYLIFMIFNSLGYLPRIWGPILFLISIITLAIAFLKLNFLPFHRWVFVLISKVVVPQKRIWNNSYEGKMYFDAFTQSSAAKKPKNNEFKNEKSLLEIENLKKSIFNQQGDQNKNQEYKFDEEDKMEIKNRFK